MIEYFSIKKIDIGCYKTYIYYKRIKSTNHQGLHLADYTNLKPWINVPV